MTQETRFQRLLALAVYLLLRRIYSDFEYDVLFAQWLGEYATFMETTKE